ncbi:hypothetical protein V1279_006606 [Bradyrhizobium sp. AZCC 1610]|uniref:hypothetical protein n=1 Tax=Bradyrhizobium sp. AZCC 1610 TaxID=3117020 RepID=UPI002FF424F3
MFAQILNRKLARFVLDKLDAIKRHRHAEPQMRAAPPPVVPDLGSTEIQHLAAEVRNALARATPSNRSPAEIAAVKGAASTRWRSLDEILVTDRSLAIPEPAHSSPDCRMFDKFLMTGIGLISCLVTMGIRKFESPHAFNAVPLEARS